MATYKAVNIQWDTDGDEEVFASLPSEVIFPDGMEDEDEMSDYLSDTVGFCHFGFSIVEA